MEKKEANRAKPAVVIRLRMVPQYQGVSQAARYLGVSGTQVKRHITGEMHSKRLARRMLECGVVVEK